MEHFPEVKVLFNGFSENHAEGSHNNCSCTLIKGPPYVIVDTMTAWDGQNIKAALHKQGIKCDDINYVVCTHGHSDHIGCNYLFQNATHIVGFCISRKSIYYNHDFQNGAEYYIHDKIRVIPTPGHTLQDVSVIVKTGNGTVAITGDLFENQQDLEDDTIWENAGSDCPTLQKENRTKILQMADFIVPGHGPMFKLGK